MGNRMSYYKRARPLKTGQTTQYSSELDDGYYQKGIPKTYTVLTTGQYSGTTNVDLAHLQRSDISFDAASKEIRCTGQMGVFKAAGGETIVVTGSTSNNTTFTTVSATADKVVVSETVVDEAAGATVTIAKRESFSNNCVIDNMTGLMWLRYCSTKMGTGGDGKMPWTGQLYDVFAWCAAVNAVSVGGYNDWRVSNIFELISILDGEAPNSVPDSTAFPSWPSAVQHWTSSTRTTNTTQALAVYSTSITVSGTATTGAYFVALVRG
jgi:hypothetical protein